MASRCAVAPITRRDRLGRRDLLRGLAGAALTGWPSGGHAAPAAPARVPKRERFAMLTELLFQNRLYDVEYQGGLSNHLSMALVALQRLGATDARLREYFDRYR